jgi:protein involved in polysaccharide export with SLBB domain
VIDVPLAAREEGGGTSDASASVVIPELTLEDGDSVTVDPIIPFDQSLYVTITGMVTKPGQYAWSEGMTLHDLVLLGRGPRVGADLREAEIARLPADRATGTLVEPLRVPLDSSYLYERDAIGRSLGAEGIDFPPSGSAPQVVLEPFDQVTVFRQPEFELQRAVRVTGEVLFPGTYALTRKDERLGDLVARAGGLTATAYAEGGRFYRSFEDAGRVNIDLALALSDLGGTNDIVLQPGDSLYVPEYIPTVRVEGAVNVPTSVLYKEGGSLNYYIANAGGYARVADKGNVSVRYANGTARLRSGSLFFRTSPKPQPGSVVFVPAKDPEDRVDLGPIVASVAQILAATVTLVVALTR